MKLLIISASQRIASQSAKVAQYIARQDQGFTSVSHFELCRFNLPFWDGDSETKSLMAVALKRSISKLSTLMPSSLSHLNGAEWPLRY
ncbi:hypothetical protein TUM4644_10260 [Shewanella colwelliana]|nr:hypothetical protein TUM4644_10260 [Shewanella colwelliana]